jgi:hypothetical protein
MTILSEELGVCLFIGEETKTGWSELIAPAPDRQSWVTSDLSLGSH